MQMAIRMSGVLKKKFASWRGFLARAPRRKLEGMKRIHNRDIKGLEVSLITRRHSECVNASRGRYHGILKNRFRQAVLQKGPFAKASTVHRQYFVRLGDFVEPFRESLRFLGILEPGDLNASLKFSESYGGEADLPRVQTA
jgi:hypothetical protein